MKTEEFLQEHKYYRTLIESATDYVVAINRNYQIIMANELFKNEFGMQPNDYCYNVWKNRNKKCEECLVEKTYQDGWGHWNVENVTMKDGRVANMLIKAIPVKNESGEVVYVLERATDITEREHIQENIDKIVGNLEDMLANRLEGLQKSEEKYRTIFERSRGSYSGVQNPKRSFGIGIHSQTLCGKGRFHRSPEKSFPGGVRCGV